MTENFPDMFSRGTYNTVNGTRYINGVKSDCFSGRDGDLINVLCVRNDTHVVPVYQGCVMVMVMKYRCIIISKWLFIIVMC